MSESTERPRVACSRLVTREAAPTERRGAEPAPRGNDGSERYGMKLRLQRLDSVRAIARREWNGLTGEGPFARHEFLLALERSGSIGAGTGWDPAHIVAFDAAGALAGVLPLYVKHDSYGEFVFDWAWA